MRFCNYWPGKSSNVDQSQGIEKQVQPCLNVASITIAVSKVPKQIQTRNLIFMATDGHDGPNEHIDSSITSGTSLLSSFLLILTKSLAWMRKFLYKEILYYMW